MSVLCSFQHLSLSYGPKQLFDEAQIVIHHDDRIGLLGLNGKGKSSLFKVLMGQVTPDKTTPPCLFDHPQSFKVFLIPQEVTFPDHEDISIRNYFFSFYPKLKDIQNQLDEINKVIESSVNQDLEKVVEKQKVLLENFEQEQGWELIHQFESYLKFFGLDDLKKSMKLLSGGEQKKVLLSLGFSARADLILWDEPTNHLDLESIQVFEQELIQSRQTFILITHDRYLLNKCTNRIVQIEREKIHSFSGSYRDYLEHLATQEAAQKKLLDKLKNKLRRETDWMRQGIKARGTRSKKRVENYHQVKDSIKSIKERVKKELDLSIASSQRKTKTLVEFDNVSFGYDENSLFSNLTFRIAKGDRIGLLGGNGVGKSTLVKLIQGSLSCQTGQIKRPDDLVVQYFSQKREELDLNKNPFEILGDGNDHVILPNGSQKHVASYFESFLFSRDDLYSPIKNFSGGEKNRLHMALNFLRAGDFWIFDEPTNDLDLETLQVLEQKLIDFPGSLILISHDRAFLSAVTNRVWLLDQKRLEYFEGGYEQVEPYLEALALENELVQQDELPAPSIDEETLVNEPAKKIKLTNKEKMRLKVIEQEIQDVEIELEKLNKQIEDFDFSDHSKQDEFNQLSAQQSKKEEFLLALYEEFELLQEKLSIS